MSRNLTRKERELLERVHITPLRYEVSLLPPGFPEREPWVLSVERRADLWAVRRVGLYPAKILSIDNTWDDEPAGSVRTSEFKATHYMPLEQALEAARERAVVLEVRCRYGMLTAQEMLDLTEDEKEERDKRGKRNWTGVFEQVRPVDITTIGHGRPWRPEGAGGG